MNISLTELVRLKSDVDLNLVLSLKSEGALFVLTVVSSLFDAI